MSWPTVSLLNQRFAGAWRWGCARVDQLQGASLNVETAGEDSPHAESARFLHNVSL